MTAADQLHSGAVRQSDVGQQHVRHLRLSADLDMPGSERERLRWMVEEFRLSLFAQDLRTLLPVSAKRLEEQLQLALREAAGSAAVPAARGASQR